MTEPRTVQIPDFTDEFPLDAMLAQREKARLDAAWEAAGGTNVDLSEEGTQKAAEGGKQMPSGKAPLRPDAEAPSEQVRDKVELDGPVRQGADKVLRTLTGVGLDETQAAIEQGTLGDKVSLKLLDPAGQIMEDRVADALRKSGGIEESEIPGMAAKVGIALGMLFPPGGISGARKGAHVAAEAVGDVKAGPVAMAGGRLARQAAPDMKAVATNIAVFNAARMTPGTVSHAETIAKAGGMTLDDALRVDPAKFDLAAIETGVAFHYKQAEAYFMDLARRLEAGDKTVEAEYWGAFAIATDLAEKAALLGTQTGRGLESLKITLAELAGSADPTALQRMAETMAGGVEAGMDAATHARRMLALPASKRPKVLIDTINYWKAGQNAFMEAWINGLLSGPQTHIANTLGSAAMAAWAPFERTMAATADAVLTGGGTWAQRNVYYGEVPQMMYGMVEGLKDGLRILGKQLKEETTVFTGKAPKFVGEDLAAGAGKVEHKPAITAEAFGLDPSTAFGGTVDLIGGIVRGSGRGLMTEDAVIKAVNYRAELRALAFREASQEGFTGKAFWKRVREIIAEPPAQVKEAADEFKLMNTLNRREGMGVMGGIAETVSTAAQNHPMLRLVAPFVWTPANSIHFASERVPVLSFISDTIRNDIFRVGGAARSLALGKITGGMGVAMVVTTYAAASITPEAPVPYMNMITGEGPKDPRVRAELTAKGWQPYSIWNPVSNQYVSYRRADPLSTILGIVANYKEITGQLPDHANQELVWAMGIATQKAMLSKTFLTGLSDLIESIEGSPQDLNRFLNGLARSGVPALIRQTMRGLDPIKRDVDTLFDHWRSGLPGYGGPQDHNVWGDGIVYEGGLGPDIVSPYYTTTVKEDATTDWLVRNRVVISNNIKAVGQYESGETPYLRSDIEKPVHLDKDERQRLKVLIGKGGDADGDTGALAGEPTLKTAIQDIIEGSGTDGPQGSKASMIQDRVNGRKAMAIRQLRAEYPKLDAELTRREQESIRLKTEDPEPRKNAGSLLDQLMKSFGR